LKELNNINLKKIKKYIFLRFSIILFFINEIF